MKIQPLENCPHCQIPVRWILHDGLNSYDCSNKQCPIEFTERVWFPSETEDFDFSAGHGILIYYGFKLGRRNLVVNFESRPTKLIMEPEYQTGNLTGKGYLVFDNPVIDFSDLEKLKKRVETWIVFS